MTQALVDKLNHQVEQHIHGRQREKILTQLQKNPTADAVASLTYELITGMDKQAEERGAPIGLDVILGVATETIDILVEIMEAMGVEMDPEEMRSESLMKMVLLHMQMVEDDPAEKAAAQEMLVALTEDGSIDQSMEYISKAANASPEQMQQAGQVIATPQQDPLAAGVQQGLMNPGAMQ